MNSKELLQAANEAQPETMKKVAAMMFLTEKLDPEFAAQNSEEASLILSRATEGLEKVSTASPHVGPWGAVGITAAGAIAAGLGTAMASDLYDAAKRGLSGARNFRTILKTNPDLEQRHDKADLRRAFNTIHRYGPEFTADPIVGGRLVASVAASPDTAPMLMKDLTSNRKNVLEAKRKQFDPRMDLGGAFLAGHNTRADAKLKSDENIEKEKMRLDNDLRKAQVELNKEHQRAQNLSYQVLMEEHKMEVADWIRKGRKGDKPELSFHAP